MHSYFHLRPQPHLTIETANMPSNRGPNTIQTKPSTPTLNIDTTSASRSNDSKLNSFPNDTPLADEALCDVMSKHYNQSIIAKIRDCQSLRYAPSYLQTWDQENRLQKSMNELMTMFSQLEKFDERYNYGVGDGTIYLPHLADPNPSRSKIQRQLVEWASECEGDDLPTFQDALKQARQIGSAHQALALSLDHVRGFRQLTQAEQNDYVVKWGKLTPDKDDKVDGVSV
jgi:hypothetical protein